mgnify:FL=1
MIFMLWKQWSGKMETGILKNKKKFKWTYEKTILTPYIILLLVLILIPMILIFFYSIIDQESELPIYTITFKNYIAFFNNQSATRALLKSILLAVVSTIFCVIFAYPISYFIARRSPKTQATLILLVTAPMWVNMLLRTMAVKQIFEGPLLIILRKIHILGENDKILGSYFAVVFGMVYNYLPYMVLPIYTTLSKLDEKLIEASTDLGASKGQTFRRVIMPLSIPGVLSGVTIVFLSAATTIVISKYMGDGKFVLIGNIIETEFITNSAWGNGSAISMILLVIILLILWLTNKATKKAGGDE